MFVFKSNMLFNTGLKDQKCLLSLDGNVPQTSADRYKNVRSFKFQ